ncbi:hypothetical protein EJB05_08719, partial [Eragrostis curvula]
EVPVYLDVYLLRRCFPTKPYFPAVGAGRLTGVTRPAIPISPIVVATQSLNSLASSACRMAPDNGGAASYDGIREAAANQATCCSPSPPRPARFLFNHCASFLPLLLLAGRQQLTAAMAGNDEPSLDLDRDSSGDFVLPTRRVVLGSKMSMDEEQSLDLDDDSSGQFVLLRKVGGSGA